VAPVVAPAPPELTPAAVPSVRPAATSAADRRPGLDAAIALVVAAGLVVLALSGGAYDVVVRQAAGVVLWWAVGLGALLLPTPRRPTAAGIAVLAFALAIALWAAIGLRWTVSTERTATEVARGVMHLAPLVLIGWVMPARHWRAVIAGVVAGATVIVVVALLGRLWPSLAGELHTLAPASTTQRLSFPLGYWNAIGSWAAITAVALLTISAHTRPSWGRALMLAPVPAASAVVYLTYSRSAILVAAAGMLVALACSRHRWSLSAHVGAAVLACGVVIATVHGAPEIARSTGTDGATRILVAVLAAGAALAAIGALTHRLGSDALRLPARTARALTAAALIAAALVGIAAAAQYGDAAWRQFNDTQDVISAEPSARLTSLSGTRIDQWRAALDAWQEDPMRGTGAGTFELTWNVRATSREFVRDAHNAYLEALTEQGVPGLLLLLALVGAIGAVAFAAVRRAEGAADRGLVAAAVAAIAMFLLGTAADWFWEVTALAVVVLTLTGALIAAARPAGDAPAGGAARLRGGRLVRGGLVIAATAAVLTQLPGLVGTSELRRSQAAAQAGDLAAAREHASTAIDALPWAASPLLQRGLIAEQAGDHAAARGWLELAIRRDPRDWRYPLTISRIEARAGNYAASVAAFRRAKALRPRGSFFR
jgi:O-antigen ligase